MVAETQKDSLSGMRERRARRQRSVFLRRFLSPLRKFLGQYLFSSLTRRILFLNLAALAVLVSGILYMNQFREGLIDAKIESLLTQGKIIAAAISASATVDTNSLLIDPEKLLELQAGQSITPSPDSPDNWEFPINPEKVSPLLRQLISPTSTRARIYDRYANKLLDSRALYSTSFPSSGPVLRYDLPPIEDETPALWKRIGSWLSRLFYGGGLPLYQEQPGGNGLAYQEIVKALSGSPQMAQRRNQRGELIVSVAVPIQRSRAILGVLLLSTEGDDIDKIVQAERMAVFRVFGVVSAVMVILSLFLASTIANPLRKL
ncbi:histidine kinase, partial [Brucella canis]